MLFLGGLSIKIVNDRIGLWGLWFAKKEEQIGQETSIIEESPLPRKKTVYGWQKRKRNRRK
jgi:hypothetical protein